MSFLKKLFSSKRTEVWKQFGSEIGAEFIEGGFWKGDKVIKKFKVWTIVLDYYVHSNEGQHEYTRIRAPFISKDKFRFTIYRKGFFSGIGKMLGMQDIEVGYPDFDRDFIIKSNDEIKIRSLFANQKIRELIQAQPKMHLQIKENKRGLFKKLPNEFTEIYFQEINIIKDINRLKLLFSIFEEVLDYLCYLGSASKEDPHINL